MKVKAKTTFLHDELGRVAKGAEIEVTERQLRQLRGFDWVDSPTYETKVVKETPAAPKNKRRDK